MEIKLLKYKQIDIVKYDNCIANSPFSRVEAFSWYLDITTNKKWNVFVYGDYEIVMPVYFKRTKQNIFVKKIAQPMFSQQLGFFSENEIETSLQNAFLESLSKYIVISNQFNIGCQLESQPNINLKVNFELVLDKSYAELSKGYSKGLKSNLKKALKEGLEISNEISVSQLISFKEENARHSFKPKNKKMLVALLTQLNDRELGNTYGVFIEGNLVSCCYIIKNKDRLVYLSSTTNEAGKKIGANSFVLDKLIEKYSESDYVLDFEGSTVKGIAYFFKSFGSVDNPYVEFSNQ